MHKSKKDLSWQGSHKRNPSVPKHEARCSPACRPAPSTKAIAPCPRRRSLGSRGRGSPFPIDPDLALGIRISRILSGVVRDRNGQAWLAILREPLDLPAIAFRLGTANGPIPCGGQAVDHTAPVGFRTALKELENKPSTCDRRSASLVKPVGLDVKRKVESELVVRKWSITGTRNDYFRLLMSQPTSIWNNRRLHRHLLLPRTHHHNHE